MEAHFVGEIAGVGVLPETRPARLDPKDLGDLLGQGDRSGEFEGPFEALPLGGRRENLRRDLSLFREPRRAFRHGELQGARSVEGETDERVRPVRDLDLLRDHELHQMCQSGRRTEPVCEGLFGRFVVLRDAPLDIENHRKLHSGCSVFGCPVLD